MTIVYRRATASQEDVFQHLKACDQDFVPPLSSRVDLRAYAGKLAGKAISFEAWHGPVLIGMINVYLNDLSTGIAYITNVSVLCSHAHQGIASTLLEMCLQEARVSGIDTVRLEVSPANGWALALYQKTGFEVAEQSGGFLVMVRALREASGEELL